MAEAKCRLPSADADNRSTCTLDGVGLNQPANGYTQLNQV